MTSTDTQAARPTLARSSFRPDIEGLRAVAIGLGLVYHAGVRQLPGGFVDVDVFFVISGFLITGLPIREIETHGRLSRRRCRFRDIVSVSSSCHLRVSPLNVKA